jgi:hypothetical protein
VDLHRLPELQEIVTKHTNADERDEKVNEWFKGKMGQLETELARVNNDGWVHGDIKGNAGNVRWDKTTGQPYLIDWGSARNWRNEAAQPGKGKGKMKEGDKKDTIDHDTWELPLRQHVTELTDNQQKGTQQTTGSTEAKLGGGCE